MVVVVVVSGVALANADKRVADKRVADKRVADKQVADKQVADKQVADKQAADKADIRGFLRKGNQETSAPSLQVTAKVAKGEG